MIRDDSTTAQSTPDELIAKIVEDLRGDEQTDSTLLDILSENIVQLTPTETAVADAVKAMEALAEKRAEELADDPTDHD